MILPIYAYGQPVLKKVGVDIDVKDPLLPSLIDDMWETMYHAQGIGLAAPQIGKSVRIFLVDTVQAMEEGEEDLGIKKVFINAQILEETGEEWSYEEGCLSIPKIRGDVSRQQSVTIQYDDLLGQQHTETYDGINARVIQHEYDHIDGKLFTEKLKPLKKKMINRKLEAIKKGKVGADYRMKYIKA